MSVWKDFKGTLCARGVGKIYIFAKIHICIYMELRVSRLGGRVEIYVRSHVMYIKPIRAGYTHVYPARMRRVPAVLLLVMGVIK